MNLDKAIEILNKMILKEHKEGNNKQALYTKEQLMIFCKKLLIEIKNA